MKRIILVAGLGGGLVMGTVSAGTSETSGRVDDRGRVVARVMSTPPTVGVNPFYIGNRAPLSPSPFLKLPIGSIMPGGWLQKQLELETVGMTGKLPEISKWCRFEGNAWAAPDGLGHSAWEELPYWLKGFGDLGYITKDPAILKATPKWIDAVLASQEPDGWFGPRASKTSLEGKPDLWPHMVMCNVLQSFCEYTEDPRVVPFLTRYFRWLDGQPGTNFGRGYWPKLRFGDNIETIYWVYNRTSEPWLLGLAERIHQNMARWDSGVIDWHNVNIAQGFRAATVFSQQSREVRHLDSAERNYRQVMDLYGQFPGGGFGGDENCRPGYTDPRQGFETCGIVEFMHSFEMLTRISGNPVWSDRCEELAFNSLPAAMTPDLKALHYLTCANQIQLDKDNKAPGIQNGGTMFSYSPYEPYRCCQHNVSHGWPYYAEELWLATQDRGICASLYAASEVIAKVGGGESVKITEQTDYPFGETIRFTFAMEKDSRFPLYLRLPGWCANPSVKVNGRKVSIHHKQGAGPAYAALDQTWRDGDAVELTLPMKLSTRLWQKNHDAVSVSHGPLIYSLKIGERWSRYGGSDAWPELEVFPTTPWNYGLVLGGSPEKSFKVVRGKLDPKVQPFTPENIPIRLEARARRIPSWKEDSNGMVERLQASPVKSQEPLEQVTLIPMGAARLRISAFPWIGTGGKSSEWAAPKSLPLSASHCHDGDTLEALVDGLEPSSSNDHSIPRFTWWDHRGGVEWVCRDFRKPTKISSVEVYWFDDTGAGQCRVPAKWRVLYRQGERWFPVFDVPSKWVEEAPAPNKYNRCTFQPVEATALKIEVELQPGFSGGILEWKCK